MVDYQKIVAKFKGNKESVSRILKGFLQVLGPKLKSKVGGGDWAMT